MPVSTSERSAAYRAQLSRYYLKTLLESVPQTHTLSVTIRVLILQNHVWIDSKKPVA
jgi:hypothetical protein